MNLQGYMLILELSIITAADPEKFNIAEAQENGFKNTNYEHEQGPYRRHKLIP